HAHLRPSGGRDPVERAVGADGWGRVSDHCRGLVARRAWLGCCLAASLRELKVERRGGRRQHALRFRSFTARVTFHGAIAQLGGRLNGIKEVTGSIPVSSTQKRAEITRESARAFLEEH